MIRYIATENIHEPEWGLKNINPERYLKLRASIAKNGQTKNILVRVIAENEYEIIDGRIVFKILRELGAELIYCKVFEVTLEEGILLYLENNIAFETNFVKVAHGLKQLNLPLYKVERTIPYNLNELTDLMKLNEFNWAKYEEESLTGQQSLFPE